MKLTAESTVLDDKKIGDSFATLQVEADGIRTEVGTKVGNDEVISRINQTAESVKIQANRIQIDGVITAINDNTTTTIDGDKITTGTLSASAVDAESGEFDTANIPNLSANKITTDTINIARIPATARNDTYITDIGSDGIRVHDSHTTNNSIVINSYGMEVFKGGTAPSNSVAFYGQTARIGKEGEYHTSIEPESIEMVGSESELLWTVQASGTEQVDSSTLTEYGVTSTSSTLSGTKTAIVDISTWDIARTVTIKCVDSVSGTSSTTRSISNNSAAISSASFFSNKATVTFTKSGGKLNIQISITTTNATTRIIITQSASSQLPKINFYGNNNVLWESSGLTYPTESDVITLLEPISAQPSGIALLWGYNGGKNSINVQFIPKYCILNSGFSGFPSGEICSATRNYPAYKVIYITSDTTIKGVDANATDGTSSFDSIHYYNSRWGLIAVLGV